MTQPPILPKTFAGYVHPLRSRYTEGSDQKPGLSAAEAKKLKVDIAISSVLSKDEKAEANALVDKAVELTQTALKDGKMDAAEKQKILDLADHGLDLQPLNHGKAAPKVEFADQHLPLDQLKSRLFRVACATSYAPKNTTLQGGTKDSLGKPLAPHTLERYIAALKAGNASPNQYVAIAMDQYLFQGKNAPLKYGDVFRIPEIEQIYGVAPIFFALVDNGGAFKSTDGTKVDICCQSPYTQKVNQTVSLHQMLKPDGQPLNISDLD